MALNNGIVGGAGGSAQPSAKAFASSSTGPADQGKGVELGANGKIDCSMHHALHYVRVTQNTGQVIADTTVTSILFNNGAGAGLANYNSATGEYTAPEDGIYSLSSDVAMLGVVGGVTMGVNLIIEVNGIIVRRGGHEDHHIEGAGGYSSVGIDYKVPMVAGDKVVLRIYQNNSNNASRPIQADSQWAWMDIYKVGRDS